MFEIRLPLIADSEYFKVWRQMLDNQGDDIGPVIIGLGRLGNWMKDDKVLLEAQREVFRVDKGLINLKSGAKSELL